MQAARLSSSLFEFLSGEAFAPVILCIGSDRVTGDSLGPLVGHLLTARYDIPAFVYGTLSHPVTAANLVETIAFIKARHPQSKVVVIDAAVGRCADIGAIKVARGGIEPGSALGRNLPKVGDFSITAVVAAVAPETSLLQDIRLGLIYRLSEEIAHGVGHVLRAIYAQAVTDVMLP